MITALTALGLGFDWLRLDHRGSAGARPHPHDAAGIRRRAQQRLPDPRPAQRHGRCRLADPVRSRAPDQQPTRCPCSALEEVGMRSFVGDDFLAFHLLLMTDDSGTDHKVVVAEAATVYPDTRAATTAFANTAAKMPECDGMQFDHEAVWQLAVNDVEPDTVRWNKEQMDPAVPLGLPRSVSGADQRGDASDGLPGQRQWPRRCRGHHGSDVGHRVGAGHPLTCR